MFNATNKTIHRYSNNSISDFIKIDKNSSLTSELLLIPLLKFTRFSLSRHVDLIVLLLRDHNNCTYFVHKRMI